MLKAEAPTDLILYQILVQNGLGLYTTWTTIASLINLAIAYVHDGGVEDPAPSLIALLFLTFILLIWTLLELMFWDKYFRYIMTPLFGMNLFIFYEVLQTRNLKLIFFSCAVGTLWNLCTAR